MSYTLQPRFQRSANEKIAAFVGNANHYIVPASAVKDSFVSEVAAKVKSLQSIVDAMTRKANTAFTSAALSYFSETLIIAVGIAACQRLIDEPDLCTSDDTYIRRVISTALIVKNDGAPDTSNHL